MVKVVRRGTILENAIEFDFFFIINDNEFNWWWVSDKLAIHQFPSVSQDEIEKKIREIFNKLGEKIKELGGEVFNGRFYCPKNKKAVREFSNMAKKQFLQFFKELSKLEEERNLTKWLEKKYILVSWE